VALAETQVNGASKNSNERGPSSLGWFFRLGTRDFCFALVVLVGPVQNIFSIPLSPSPSNLGRQPCWVACLLVCVSGQRQQKGVIFFALIVPRKVSSCAGVYIVLGKIVLLVIVMCTHGWMTRRGKLRKLMD
jgi:hypothetical protein